MLWSKIDTKTGVGARGMGAKIQNYDQIFLPVSANTRIVKVILIEIQNTFSKLCFIAFKTYITDKEKRLTYAWV